jgi:cyclopropane-fatty-acyl-phospholipid synthase
LQPGNKVLDIGCGWGGLAIYLAKVAEVEVLGITLSTEQLAYATAGPRAKGWRPGQVRTGRLPPPDWRVRPDRVDRDVRTCRAGAL